MATITIRAMHSSIRDTSTMEKTLLLKSLLSLFLLTGDYEIGTTGMVTLSPTSVAIVCRVGDPLELTCSSSGEFSRWILTVSNEQGVSQQYRRNINFQDGSQQVSTIEINSTIFTFMRTSSQGMPPLVSTLVIDSVNRYLNGMEVRCLDLATTVTASTTIRLFDDSPSEVGPMLVASEEFGADNVTVTMEWTQEEGAVYQIVIVPETLMTSTGESSLQLILLYNTHYNLTVKSALPCQHQAHSHVLLFYANCGYLLLSAATDHEFQPITTYSGLPIQGATINFTCHTGLVLNGSNTTTCMGNGDWEPYPQELECISIFNCDPPSPPPNGYIDSYNRTAEALLVNFICQNRITCICPDEMEDAEDILLHTAVCTLDGNWEPNLEDFCSRKNTVPKSSSDVNIVTVIVATAVAAMLASNAFIFVVGCICGHHFYQKCKKLIKGSRNNQPSPVEVTRPRGPNSVTGNEQELELEENVAYGHFQDN